MEKTRSQGPIAALRSTLPPPPPAPSTSHVVEAGDTLWGIADAYAIPFDQLRQANYQLSNPDLLQLGQAIFLPDPSVLEFRAGYRAILSTLADVEAASAQGTSVSPLLARLAHQVESFGRLYPSAFNGIMGSRSNHLLNEPDRFVRGQSIDASFAVSLARTLVERGQSSGNIAGSDELYTLGALIELVQAYGSPEPTPPFRFIYRRPADRLDGGQAPSGPAIDPNRIVPSGPSNPLEEARGRIDAKAASAPDAFNQQVGTPDASRGFVVQAYQSAQSTPSYVVDRLGVGTFGIVNEFASVWEESPSRLGYPLEDEHAQDPGARQNFQHGQLRWNPRLNEAKARAGEELRPETLVSPQDYATLPAALREGLLAPADPLAQAVSCHRLEVSGRPMFVVTEERTGMRHLYDETGFLQASSEPRPLGTAVQWDPPGSVALLPPELLFVEFARDNGLSRTAPAEHRGGLVYQDFTDGSGAAKRLFWGSNGGPYALQGEISQHWNPSMGAPVQNEQVLAENGGVPTVVQQRFEDGTTILWEHRNNQDPAQVTVTRPTNYP